MRILLACDKFKGSLDASSVAEGIAAGFYESYPDAEYLIRPIADGGEGFTETLVNAMAGELQSTVVEDALGREIEATWGLIPWGDGQQAAVIEMSAASGLWCLAEHERKIMQASTYGTGQLIRDAVENHQVAHLYLGLGGSATNDMGCGMAQALGVSFSGVTGRVVPANLGQVSAISLEARIPLPPITVACDVDSPLCGETGASAVFGPQKGASASQVAELDELLAQLAALSPTPSHATTPGAGAAGGLGFGMIAFAGAELVPGFDLVAQATQLEEQVRQADLVITGEGGLDAQSLSGKGPLGVAKLALKYSKPCLAVAGKIDYTVDWTPYFQHTSALIDTGTPMEELIANTREHLVKLSRDLATRVDSPHTGSDHTQKDE